MNTPLRFAALLVLVIGLAACARSTNPTVIGIAVSITATDRSTAFPPTGTPLPTAAVPAPTEAPTPRPPEPAPTAIPFHWIKVSALEFLQLQEKGLPEQCSQVLFDPFDEDVMYLLNTCPPNGSGKLYRSLDRGVTWQACWEGGGNISSQTQLIIDPQDENHLLITVYAGQLMESVDGCQTWNNAGIPGISVSSLVQGRPGSVYAATDAGVYGSFDSGKTWAALNTGLPVEPRVYSLAADPSDPSVIFAVTTQGLYRLER